VQEQESNEGQFPDDSSDEDFELTGKVPASELRERITIAFHALGGREWKKDCCNCDREIGYECEYCAIHDGLECGEEFADRLAELRADLDPE
jgi:hypothetical protein